MDEEQKKKNQDQKDEQLEQFRVKDEGEDLTTNQGLKMSEDEFSLKAGERADSLRGFSLQRKNDSL